MNCGNCEISRNSGQEMVYCRLYGIYIRAGHEGCKYHKKRPETEGKTA